MTISFVLLLMAISSYPFQPQSVLVFSLGGLIAAGVLFSSLAIFRIVNDEVLKKLTGAPTKVEQYRRMLTGFGVYAGLPLFSLLASQFPGIRSVIFDWLQPLLNFLR